MSLRKQNNIVYMKGDYPMIWIIIIIVLLAIFCPGLLDFIVSLPDCVVPVVVVVCVAGYIFYRLHK